MPLLLVSSVISFRTVVLFSLLCALVTGCATRSSADSHNVLPQSVAAALKTAQLPESSLSVIVRPVGGGPDALRQDSERPSAPASVMKLPTTLAALELLGPVFRSSVQLWTAAAQEGERLRGDIVLRGRGHTEFDFAQLEALLAKLRAKGVRVIEGDLIVDRSYFSPTRMDVGVPAFDESPEFRYNIIPDAMMVNQNLLTLHLHSSEQEVRVFSAPALPNVSVMSELTLNAMPCTDWEDGWKIPSLSISPSGQSTITLRGAFPKNCARSTEINVLDRDVMIASSFRTIWNERVGGEWRGVSRTDTFVEAGARKLTEQFARPVNALVREVNKTSDNAISRTMYLQLGIGHTNARETSAQASERRLRAWLQGIGINDVGMVFENGSGLSRTERISALQLAQLLEYAHNKSPWSHEFIASLPVAGLDGTLRTRLTESKAKNKARVKTGTLRDVVSVAGYVPDANGKLYIVVALINHPRASHNVARPIVDALIDWVANLK